MSWLIGFSYSRACLGLKEVPEQNREPGQVGRQLSDEALQGMGQLCVPVRCSLSILVFCICSGVCSSVTFDFTYLESSRTGDAYKKQINIGLERLQHWHVA
eukprot:7811866-Karenia_brevis.AAC.1